jgi:hypothetical protein
MTATARVKINIGAEYATTIVEVGRAATIKVLAKKQKADQDPTAARKA